VLLGAGFAGSAAGSAAGCCQAETMWGHFQVLPGAAGCCRVAGLPGCRVAGLPVGCRVGLSGLLPGLCSGCQLDDSVKK
jgi:hypothetical protein